MEVCSVILRRNIECKITITDVRSKGIKQVIRNKENNNERRMEERNKGIRKKENKQRIEVKEINALCKLKKKQFFKIKYEMKY
jgi:hypothetical protein